MSLDRSARDQQRRDHGFRKVAQLGLTRRLLLLPARSWKQACLGTYGTRADVSVLAASRQLTEHAVDEARTVSLCWLSTDLRGGAAETDGC